ncbi:MAG TPA: glutamyl-tRNA amidotransferase, partial [Dehalococcoidia bacterium]|nr:glutamyl-tRNA amidotransferase [Dehalococcoidia bacterium]
MSGTNNDLAYISATEVARLIKKGEITSVEVTQLAIDRANATQGTLNAFITICEDQAIDAARSSDSAVSNGEKLGPLQGVPFTVKDLINTQGVRTTMGSLIFDENFPKSDAVAISRLKEAGAILIGKTTTPEFGHKPFTSAPIFGDTTNAWSRHRIAGGSSGGAAVAAAAGLGYIHVGTDGGGSIRIPSAANGIVGMKATLGTVPNDSNPDSFGNYSYTGPMTRTVSDAALMLSIMSGPHPSDVHSVGRKQKDYQGYISDPGDLEGFRIAWRPLLGNTIIDTELLSITSKAVKSLESHGAKVIEVDDPFESPEPFWRIINQSAWKARFGGYLSEWSSEMTPSFIRSIQEAEDYSATELQEAVYKRTTLFREVQSWFNEFDLVVTPTLSRTALEIDRDLYDPVMIEGEKAGIVRQAWYPYTHPFNLTGHPAITLPSGFHSDGLPTAIQVIGPFASDHEVLR